MSFVGISLSCLASYTRVLGTISKRIAIRPSSLRGTRPTISLFLDADDVLSVVGGTGQPTDADAYYLRIEVGGSHSFARVNMVSTRAAWRWVGAVHEVIICPDPHRIEQLDGAGRFARFPTARATVTRRASSFAMPPC